MSISNKDELIFKLPNNLFYEFINHFEYVKNENWPPKIVKEIKALIRKREKNVN